MEVAQQQVERENDVLAKDGGFDYSPSVAPEIMAWTVLLGAFLLFCVITISTILGIYFYLFESTVSIPVTLRVARGTVGITGTDLIETVERESEDITNQVVGISTDSQSQGIIQFKAQSIDETASSSLLAAITLRRNTFVTINQAVAPRFEWSTRQNNIQISNVSGKMDVLITGASANSVVLRIATQQGVIVNFNRDGRYIMTATDDEVLVNNLSGEAVVFFSDDFSNNKLIPSGQEAVVKIANRSIVLETGTTDLVSNGSFSLQTGTFSAQDIPTLPAGWGCRINQNELPRGTFTIEEFDGRVGLRLRRLDNATSNGEAGCVHPFGENGIDVTSYDSIKIVTSFYLNYQSLSKCGIAGSECPLMLLLTYDDSLGITRRWFRGFFYDDQLANDYPLRCSSCTQDHQDINEKVWYTFESENLFSLISDDRRPARIKSIEFYASGHQFDTVISDMMILASSSVDDSFAEGN